MNAAQHLVTRLTETERIQIRSASTEAAVVGLYHQFKSELPGGHLHGGTEADGIEAMKQVVVQVNAEFTVASQTTGF